MRFICALMNIRSVLSKHTAVPAVPAVSAVSEQAGEIVSGIAVGQKMC